MVIEYRTVESERRQLVDAGANHSNRRQSKRRYADRDREFVQQHEQSIGTKDIAHKYKEKTGITISPNAISQAIKRFRDKM